MRHRVLRQILCVAEYNKTISSSPFRDTGFSVLNGVSRCEREGYRTNPVRDTKFSATIGVSQENYDGFRKKAVRDTWERAGKDVSRTGKD